jgi:hypothetical protein
MVKPPDLCRPFVRWFSRVKNASSPAKSVGPDSASEGRPTDPLRLMHRSVAWGGPNRVKNPARHRSGPPLPGGAGHQGRPSLVVIAPLRRYLHEGASDTQAGVRFGPPRSSRSRLDQRRLIAAPVAAPLTGRLVTRHPPRHGVTHRQRARGQSVERSPEVPVMRSSQSVRSHATAGARRAWSRRTWLGVR